MRTTALVVALVLTAGGATRVDAQTKKPADDVRVDAIARASVWSPTDVPRMNLRTGPTGAGSFAPNAIVDCAYVKKDMGGNTPKFTCRLQSGREVKVKYGRDNGEVYAEVAATRLLWALGFGADHMYPVRIRCRGCPHGTDEGTPTPKNEILMIDAAAIELKMPGRSLDDSDGSGWTWTEFDEIKPAPGGAPAAQRDALKLLAAMLQHTDSKKDQQRIVCLDRQESRRCGRPFMLISDVGKTFGKANAFNRDSVGSVNLKAWADAPVWTDAASCHANLGKSVTGTLDNPLISEAGRKFLADLLGRLTDRQLRDLFVVARFPMRTDAQPGDETVEIDAWVKAFKDKVAQIEQRTCRSERVA